MKTILLLFSALIFFAAPVAAQVSIEEGPHNGMMQTYMNHKVEVVGCNEYLEVYFYDKDLHPINNNFGVVGDVKFYTSDQVYASSPLVAYGADGFTARIPTPEFIYARVTATIAGQVVTAKFGNECRVSVRK